MAAVGRLALLDVEVGVCIAEPRNDCEPRWQCGLSVGSAAEPLMCEASLFKTALWQMHVIGRLQGEDEPY